MEPTQDSPYVEEVRVDLFDLQEIPISRQADADPICPTCGSRDQLVIVRGCLHDYLACLRCQQRAGGR